MNWLFHFNRWFSGLPQWLVLILCGIGVLVLAWLDAIIQPHASEDFLYVAVVAAATWYVGRKAGIGMAVFSAIIWFISSMLDSQITAPYLLRVWDSVSLLVIYLIMAISIAALKTRMLKLDDLASQDPLTGLNNRRAFYHSVAQEAARSRRSHSTYTIAYIDVDNFKKVNDTYGHAGGDNVLVTIAAVIKNNLRQSDTVARMGGDEFVLLLPDTDADQGQKAIKKLFARLTESMLNKQLPVTFSIGAVTFKDEPCPVDEMVKRADRLMYEIKGDLKNGIRFETDCSCNTLPLSQDEPVVLEVNNEK